MEIEIRFQGLEDAEPLREHATALVQTHLGRFRSELTHVEVLVGRRNGASRPEETRYQITVSGPRLPSTIVDHRGLNAALALASAIERTARAVVHDLGRARSRAVAARTG